MRAPPLLDGFGGHPQRGPVPRQRFDAADVREHPVRGRVDDPPRFDGQRPGQPRSYLDSSFRMRRVPSTIAVNFATVSSTVRVLSPQSGVTYT